MCMVLITSVPMTTILCLRQGKDAQSKAVDQFTTPPGC